MKIETKYHDIQNIQDSEILTFEEGIPGFLDETKFILLGLTDDQTFSVLQSVKTAALAFVVTSPFLTYPQYEFHLDDDMVEQMGMSRNHLAVFSIVTVKEPFVDSTMNLQAPVLIDVKAHKGKQLILNNEAYQIRTPLFPKPEHKEE